MATFSRVYWKALEVNLGVVKRYIQRYDLQLQASLTPTQYTCVVAVLDAIVACLLILPSNDPTE